MATVISPPCVVRSVLLVSLTVIPTSFTAECRSGYFPCHRDCCERKVQYCHGGEERCLQCEKVKHLCGNHSLPHDCDAFCLSLEKCATENDGHLVKGLAAVVVGLSLVIIAGFLVFCWYSKWWRKCWGSGPASRSDHEDKDMQTSLLNISIPMTEYSGCEKEDSLQSTTIDGHRHSAASEIALDLHDKVTASGGMPTSHCTSSPTEVRNNSPILNPSQVGVSVNTDRETNVPESKNSGSLSHLDRSASSASCKSSGSSSSASRTSTGDSGRVTGDSALDLFTQGSSEHSNQSADSSGDGRQNQSRTMTPESNQHSPSPTFQTSGCHGQRFNNINPTDTGENASSRTITCGAANPTRPFTVKD